MQESHLPAPKKGAQSHEIGQEAEEGSCSHLCLRPVDPQDKMCRAGTLERGPTRSNRIASLSRDDDSVHQCCSSHESVSQRAGRVCAG